MSVREWPYGKRIEANELYSTDENHWSGKNKFYQRIIILNHYLKKYNK